MFEIYSRQRYDIEYHASYILTFERAYLHIKADILIYNHNNDNEEKLTIFQNQTKSCLLFVSSRYTIKYRFCMR